MGRYKVRWDPNDSGPLPSAEERNLVEVGPSDAQVRMLQDYAANHSDLPAWKDLVAEVDSGKTAWLNVLSGMQSGSMTPPVKAAFDSLLRARVPKSELIAMGVWSDSEAIADSVSRHSNVNGRRNPNVSETAIARFYSVEDY